MDKFESQFEDMDVKTQHMETSVASTTAVSAPLDDVAALLRQVADTYQLQLKEDMANVPTLNLALPEKQESLDDRLARLRSTQ
jgi:division protein CdvB (Snf7/Vps24/ESCRT-III family)